MGNRSLTTGRTIAAAVLLLALGGCGDGGGSRRATATATGSATPSHTATSTFTPTESPTPTQSPTPSATPTETTPVEWTTLGQSQMRTYFNARETRITRNTVSTMRPKWKYLTGAVITASPSVAYVDVPGEGRVKIVVTPSWDGFVYALRASNGSRLWSFEMKPHPGGSFPFAASAEIAEVAGELRVYVAGGMTVYCLDAVTGALRWEFDAGTGCTTCDRRTERNEVESSPTVVGDLVYFAMDVNDAPPGKGGVYAVDATEGHLVWYFDLETDTTCRPLASDRIHRFDGFHTEEELGLPEGFLATRPGCNFDRTWTACGNVWSSFAVDETRGWIYTASSNCDTDDDPETVDPAPPMPPYDEALFALTFDGDPVWVWRPREVDPFDLAFGAVPNLFEVEIGGELREVVGIGNKDGTYYLLDRDGVNELTGRIEPYWQTNVVPGGPIGGIIASAAVGEGKVLFSTAVGFSLSNPQRPAAWGLRATDGEVLWSNAAAAPSFGPTSAIPGIVFMGGIDNTLKAYDSDTGERLAGFALGQPATSAAAIVDGEIFVGAGVGERGTDPDDIAYITSLIPNPISAFCLPDAPDCPQELCDDGDRCTYDFHGETGCESEPAPDGLFCQVDSQHGACLNGVCVVEPSS